MHRVRDVVLDATLQQCFPSTSPDDTIEQIDHIEEKLAFHTNAADQFGYAQQVHGFPDDDQEDSPSCVDVLQDVLGEKTAHLRHTLQSTRTSLHVPVHCNHTASVSSWMAMQERTLLMLATCS